MPVRPATLADAQAIAEVHVASWQTSYRGIVPQHILDVLSFENRLKQWTGGFGNPLRGLPILVAVDGHRVVGFADGGPSRDADAKPKTMELYAIYLLQEFQRKGLGRELWTSMVASIKNTGATAVTVWVLVANTPAQNFYKALGFRPDGEVKTVDVGEVNLRELRYRLPLMQSAQA